MHVHPAAGLSSVAAALAAKSVNSLSLAKEEFPDGGIQPRTSLAKIEASQATAKDVASPWRS